MKKPAMLTMGLVALVLGLFLESVLHPAGKAGHFAVGFFMGVSLVLLIAGAYRHSHARTHNL